MYYENKLLFHTNSLTVLLPNRVDKRSTVIYFLSHGTGIVNSKALCSRAYGRTITARSLGGFNKETTLHIADSLVTEELRDVQMDVLSKYLGPRYIFCRYAAKAVT